MEIDASAHGLPSVKAIEGSLIKEKGLKLSKGRKQKLNVKDCNALKQGRKDIKDINVRAPRIEDGQVNFHVVEEEEARQAEGKGGMDGVGRGQD